MNDDSHKGFFVRVVLKKGIIEVEKKVLKGDDRMPRDIKRDIMPEIKAGYKRYPSSGYFSPFCVQ